MLKYFLLSLFFLRMESRFNPTEIRKIQLKEKTCNYKLLVRVDNLNYELNNSNNLEISVNLSFHEI